MPTITCPICPNCASTDTNYLEHSSDGAYVHYCRCERCGHVWTVPKDGDQNDGRDITPKKPTP